MDVQRTHELRNRILFTILVVAVYMIGRSIYLYGVSVDDAAAKGMGAQNFLAMIVSGDQYRVTVMALGIAPYINASLLVQIVFAFRNATSRAKVTKMENERWMFGVSVIFALFMAWLQSYELTFVPEAGPLGVVRLIAAAEMVGGALLTSFLCMENEKHGIGTSMPIILVNILTQFVQTLAQNQFFVFPAAVLLSAIAAAVTAYMENSLIKVPLQRVSIHNIHADQNYLAYKRAPMGIMPVMFAASAFLLPYYLVRYLADSFPGNAGLAYAADHMMLTDPLGIGVYLVLIVLLAVFFAFLMLNPKETAHQLQRAGDSVIGMPAGRQTQRYLSGIVLRWSLMSGLLQAACMAASLALALQGTIPAGLAMIPASVMILVSIVCSLSQEIATYYRYDAYRFFM